MQVTDIYRQRSLGAFGIGSALELVGDLYLGSEIRIQGEIGKVEFGGYWNEASGSSGTSGISVADGRMGGRYNFNERIWHYLGFECWHQFDGIGTDQF
jgi:hypothetical protein